MHITQEMMMKELMAQDFMALELHLYLNTHPYDCRALMAYINAVQKARVTRSNYERMYGPITAGAANTYPWPWIKSPWPWE